MLESMRKYHQSVFIYIIFGLLILVFAVNFGPGSTGCSPNAGVDFAAQVNGETIPREEWARHYERTVDSYKRMMQGKGELDEAFLDKLGVRQNVMDNLVSARLVAQEARKRGVQISDDELTKFMAKAYAVEGEVTPAMYQNWVQRQFGMTVERFEQQTRDELAAQKLVAMVQEAVDVSDAEVRAAFQKEHDRAQATYVKFEPDAKVPEITDEAARAYAASNDAELQARYKADQYKYNVPEKRHVRQIVKAVAPDASAEELKKAQDALADLKKQIEGGADFAALAKANSDDASKDKGGDMGLVGVGELARALDEPVQKLKAGEMTKEPAKTPRGLHLLQVTEVVPASTKSFDDVKVEVAKSILADKALDDATQKTAQAFLAKLQSGTSLDTLTVAESDARDMPVNVKPVRYETPWILKSQESIPRIGPSTELHDAIFALEPSAPIARQPYKVGHTYYVVVYKDRERPDDTTFETTKDELRKQAVSEKKERVLRDWMDDLRSKADVKVNPSLVPATRKA